MTDLLLLGRLEDALAREGCPVCHELGLATRQYLKQFLREGKAGDLAWESFREARGFCPAHTRLLKALDAGGALEGLSTATLYGWLLADLLKDDDLGEEAPGRPSPSRWRRAGRARKWFEPSAPCPACRDMGAYAAGIVGGLQRFLSPLRGVEALQELFRRSGGLCLPHFREILSRVEDPAAYELIMEVQLRALRRLAAELEEFRKKHDHRRAGEPLGAERDAWRLALDLFGGLSPWEVGDG